jgi:hypothetical protein
VVRGSPLRAGVPGTVANASRVAVEALTSNGSLVAGLSPVALASSR